MNAAFDLGVYPVTGEAGRYHVKSSGKQQALYLVDLDDLFHQEDLGSGRGSCGCRDYEIRSGMMAYPAKGCKHIRRAQFYQMLQRYFGGARP